MEMKVGYKNTDVGLIPDDWDAVPLAELCRSICDGTHFTPRYVQHGVPFYSVENVTANDFINTKFISESEHARLIKRCRPERGDILMTRITAGVIGDTRILDWDVNASIYVSLALLKPNGRIVPEYLYRYSKSSAFVRDVEKRALINATPKKINMRDIGAVPIPIPPKKEEQIAIAEVLSDVDELLGVMEGLIAKKGDVKQAAMQQLLSGDKRLPGFYGKWERKQIRNIAEVDPENLGSQTTPDYTFNYISLEDVDLGVLKGYSEQVFRAAPSRARRILKKSDILLSTVRPNLQSHLLFSSDSPDWICSTGFSVVRCRDQVAFSPYVLFQVFGHDISRQIDALLTGSNYPAISSNDVRSLEIPLPECEEQIAIADVLTDMDVELAALQERRDKLRDLKQGMMQELLTGRTRLL